MNKFITAAALLAAVGAALAQTPATPRVDARQERQAQRIDQGQASGELTARETRRLEREQGAVSRAEDRAKADGTVTAAERKRLAKVQNAASRDLRRQKHDAQSRPGS